MMEKIVYLLKIISYFIIVFLIVNYSYNFYKNDESKKKKISFIVIIVFSALFGLYSIIVSTRPYSSDRLYYARAFVNSSLNYQLPKGYSLVSKILYFISENPDFLFFANSFIIMYLSLILYKKYKYSNPNGLKLLLFSLFYIFTFHLLKQGLAIIITSISIMYFLDKKYIKSFLIFLLAVLFHEAALIMIPLYIFLYFSQKKIVRIFGIFLTFSLIFLFSSISLLFSDAIVQLFPTLAFEIKDYFNNLRITFSGILSAFKGFPIYMITYSLFHYRKKMIQVIQDYDKYIIMSIFASLSYLLSSYMYWMYRFGLFVIFFVFMIFGNVYNNIENKKEKIFYFLSVYGVTIILTIRYLFQMFFKYGGF